MKCNPRNKNRQGSILVLIAVLFPVILAFAGLAVDMTLVYLVDTQCALATDAAILASTRGGTIDHGTSLANAVFRSNFPEGAFLTTSSQLTNLNITETSASGEGVAVVPTFFMRIIGRNSVTVRNRAQAQIVPIDDSANYADLILIDEDSIDNDLNGSYSDPDLVTIEDITLNDPPNCGNGDPSVCVNDDIASVGGRTALFTRPSNDITSTVSNLVLHSGQLGDEGFFYFSREDPQVSNQNGSTFTKKELMEFCYEWDVSGENCIDQMDENDLDKVAAVRAMGQSDIEAMVGRTYCAVVWDSDISYNPAQDEASLKGSTLGVTAFSVTGLVTPPECGSSLPGTSACSYLSHVIVDLIPSGDIGTVCSTLSPQNGSEMSANRILLVE